MAKGWNMKVKLKVGGLKSRILNAGTNLLLGTGTDCTNFLKKNRKKIETQFPMPKQNTFTRLQPFYHR